MNRLIDQEWVTTYPYVAIFYANKLIEPNFLIWYRNVRIVLKQQQSLYVFWKHNPSYPVMSMLMK
jgi:hypothetical protein